MPQKGNIRMLFDPIEEIGLDDALTRGDAFRAAKARLLRTLADPPRLMELRESWSWLLGRPMSRQFHNEVNTRLPGYYMPPFGWRIRRDYARDVMCFMPAWLYFCVETLPRAFWMGCRTLARLGFLQGPEGIRFVDMRLSRRVWESQYAGIFLRHGDERFWLPYRRWFQFWTFFARDWAERMPSWQDDANIDAQSRALFKRFVDEQRAQLSRDIAVMIFVGTW
jgi:hypothetical protein